MQLDKKMEETNKEIQESEITASEPVDQDTERKQPDEIIGSDEVVAEVGETSVESLDSQIQPVDQDIKTKQPDEVVSSSKVIAKQTGTVIEIAGTDTGKSHKRILQGKVTSNKPDKTIIVAIERQVAHPLYKKYYKRTNKFMAHDPENSCNTGDTVRIKESRPLSAKKRWELVEIIERAK
jgi:small subunit ribosomal protein S17